jgi:hypothetical protein
LTLGFYLDDVLDADDGFSGSDAVETEFVKCPSNRKLADDAFSR